MAPGGSGQTWDPRDTSHSVGATSQCPGAGEELGQSPGRWPRAWTAWSLGSEFTGAGGCGAWVPVGGAEPDRSPGARSAPTGAKLGRGGKAVAGLCRLPGCLPVLAHPQSGGRGRGSPGEAGENLGYHLPSPPSASGAESGAVAGGAACTEPAPCGRRSAGAALTGGLEADLLHRPGAQGGLHRKPPPSPRAQGQSRCFPRQGLGVPALGR